MGADGERHDYAFAGHLGCLALVAVGDGGTVRRFDGSSWTDVSAAVGEQLNNVWGTSGTNVFGAYSSTPATTFFNDVWVLTKANGQ